MRQVLQSLKKKKSAKQQAAALPPPQEVDETDETVSFEPRAAGGERAAEPPKLPAGGTSSAVVTASIASGGGGGGGAVRGGSAAGGSAPATPTGSSPIAGAVSVPAAMTAVAPPRSPASAPSSLRGPSHVANAGEAFWHQAPPSPDDLPVQACRSMPAGVRGRSISAEDPSTVPMPALFASDPTGGRQSLQPRLWNSEDVTTRPVFGLDQDSMTASEVRERLLRAQF